MRLVECEEKIDFAADACDLKESTVKEVKRAIGMRKRLNLQFPASENDFSFFPTDTVLELGKKSNALFLEKAIPILKEKIEKGTRPTKKEVIELLEHIREEIKEKNNIKSETTIKNSKDGDNNVQIDATESVTVDLFKDKRPPQTNATFNITNDKIEWATYSWNPVTGCKHGCKYCYARDIANRFYPEKFEPTFHPERLCAPTNMKLPSNENGSSRNVFVCSMADLFGDWVQQDWIDAVMKAVEESPDWNYIFLTKNPKRLPSVIFPKNAWVGATVDIQARVKPAENAFKNVNATVKFVSIEPMMERIDFKNIDVFDWIIIGGRSETSGMPSGQPEWGWVEHILNQARKKGKKIYFKPNLTVRPKEYPI